MCGGTPLKMLKIIFLSFGCFNENRWKKGVSKNYNNSNGVTYVSSDGFSNENKNALKSQAQEN